MKKDYRLSLWAIFVIFIFLSFLGCSDDGNPGSLRVRVV